MMSMRMRAVKTRRQQGGRWMMAPWTNEEQGKKTLGRRRVEGKEGER